MVAIPRIRVRNWWLVALRGVFSLLFGILAFAWPGITIAALVTLFGAYALVDGVTGLIDGVRSRSGWSVVAGILGILAGILTFIWPGITAVTLLFLIAIWAIVTGVFELLAAWRLRKQISWEWLLALGGIASIALGVVLLVRPALGALTVVWIIASYAVTFGVLLIALGFALRNWQAPPPPRSSATSS